jgi:hypothetical protein
MRALKSWHRARWVPASPGSADGSAPVELIRGLLDDPYLGIRTTAGLNAQGEALNHLETLEVEATVEEATE